MITYSFILNMYTATNRTLIFFFVKAYVLYNISVKQPYNHKNTAGALHTSGREKLNIMPSD